MRTWTRQAGYPVISVETKDVKGNISLSQERFFSSPISRKANKKKTLWKVPVSIFKSRNKTENILIEKTSSVIKPLKKGEWLKLNLNETGFYRVKYQHAFLEDLKEAILKKKLDPKDRLGLISNAFALAQGGYIPTTDVLDLLESYKNEDNYNVWVEISSGLSHLSRILENEPFRKDFETYCRNIFSPMVKKVDWSKKPKESHTDSLLRSLILANAVKYKDEQVIAKCRILFKSLLKEKHIDPDIKSIVYAAVAGNGALDEYKKLRRIYKKAKLHEEKHRVARVLPLFKEPAIVLDVLKFFMGKEVRNQDTTLFLAVALSSRTSKHLTWKFIKQNWKYLVNKFGDGGHTLSRMASALEFFTTTKDADDISEFFKKNQAPGAERSIQQSLEQIRANVEWRKKDVEAIKRHIL
jgi:aminopeptidase N